MHSTVQSCLLRGLEGRPVEVQVDISPGEVKFHVVGLAAASVREARERVRSAIRNSGLTWPNRRLTVNLAPAELRKEGSGFDLPIAVAICLAVAERPPPPAAAFIGELSLDGAVRHVDGILVAAQSLAALGFERLFVAACDAPEAALVPGVEIHPCADLGAVMAHLLGQQALPEQLATRPPQPAQQPGGADDLSEVHGQEAARRALEVAAAGGHHLLFSGPPGAGKTMLARCLPGLLPALDLTEALEVAKVRSLLGDLDPALPLDRRRPFRSPHHTISQAGLVGGGASLARPGEITRAHHGVLFLDELAEFEASTLQALRQPLESGRVTLTRSGGSVRYPARFLLVAATNPCPCGWLGDPIATCRCSRQSLASYRRSLSGPLLDRIDLQVPVPRPPLEALSGEPQGEGSASVRARVLEARACQLGRQGRLNAALGARQLREHAGLQAPARRALERWAAEMGLSGRGFHRAWRVARTLADLQAAEQVGAEHVMEALGYRVADAAA